MALLAPVVADTVATAAVGAQVNLGLALKANNASRAEAVALAALTTVLRAVGLTCLVTAGGSLPSDLAKARRIITALAILTVRADGLRAVSTTVTHIALAATGHTVAPTVARAAVGAHLLLASLAHETRSTVAHTIDASTMRRAVAWAALEGAVKPGPAHLAHAVGADAVTMSRAVVGARTARAVHTSEPSLAVASAVVADPRVGAVVEASLERAVVAHPPLVAGTGEVLAASVAGAIVGANHTLRAVGTSPPVDAVAGAVVAQTVTRAVRNAGTLAAVVALPARGAIASTIAAVAMAGAVAGACQQTAVKASVARVAVASEVLAHTVVGAVVGADALGTVVPGVARVAAAHTLLAEAVVRASVGAIGLGAIKTTEAGEATASSVEATAVLAAVVGALAGRAVHALETLGALALAVDASSASRAVVGAQLSLTAHSSEAGIANAHALRGACSTLVAVVGAVGLLTSHASPPVVALAVTVGVLVAAAVVGALHGTPLDVAHHTSVLTCLADAHAVLTVAMVAVDTLLARAVKLLSKGVLAKLSWGVGDGEALCLGGLAVIGLRLCLNIRHDVDSLRHRLLDFLESLLHTGGGLGLLLGGLSFLLVTDVASAIRGSEARLAHTATVLAIPLVGAMVGALHEQLSVVFLL